MEIIQCSRTFLDFGEGQAFLVGQERLLMMQANSIFHFRTKKLCFKH